MDQQDPHPNLSRENEDPCCTDSSESERKNNDANEEQGESIVFFRKFRAEWETMSPAKRIKFGLPILTLIALIIYTAFTAWMYFANRDAANAATDAAGTAKGSLELTRKALEASEAAGFVARFELQTNPSRYPMWVDISLSNLGKIKASEVVGSIRLVRKSPTGHLIQDETRKFYRQVVMPTDGINEIIGVDGESWNDLAKLSREAFTVTVSLTYDDGIQRTNQSVCKGPLMQWNGDSVTSVGFEDCENIEARKKYGYPTDQR